MNRRRHRSRKRYGARHGSSARKHALTVIIVIFLSVAAGYLTATQILGPALGLESQQTFFDFINNQKDGKSDEKDKEEKQKNEITVVEDKVDVEKEGFALQYGSFSTRNGAEECADDLKASGIDTEIIEADGMYKVIGNIFDTKSEAETYKEENPWEEGVFITEIK